MEQHHFNTYSSSHHSNAKHTLYLALNRHGVPRRVQIPPTRSLGNLATYTKSLTQTVEQARVDRLVTKNFGATYIRHGLKQLCDSGKQLRPLTTSLRARPKCQGGGAKTKKTEKNVTKKKKRRKCRDDEPEGDHCTKTVVHSPPADPVRRPKPKCSSSSNNNEEDCGSNLGSNKKRPAQQHPVKAKKPNQQIFAIKKLKSKPRSTTTTTTTTPAPTTPKVNIFFSSAEPALDEDEEESDEYDDHIGHAVQFVEDVYDEFQL